MYFNVTQRMTLLSCKAVVGSPAGPAMAGLVFGNGIKLTLAATALQLYDTGMYFSWWEMLCTITTIIVV